MIRNRKINIGYFVKEGIRNFFLNGFMTFASVGIIAACLLITGSFALIAINIDNIIANAQAENTITVFISEDISYEDALSMKKQIMRTPNVESAEFISKDAALQSYIEELGEDAGLFDGLEDDNPLRHSYVIKMTNIALHEEVEEALRGINGIARVESRGDISEKLINLRGMVSAASLALLAMLGGVAIFIISNMIKLATFARRQEIAIMKMVGATDSFVRWPFIVEGLLFGESAAVIAFFLQWAVYSSLYELINSGIAFVHMLPFEQFFWYIFGGFAVSGFVIGVFGSVLAIRKFLKV